MTSLRVHDDAGEEVIWILAALLRVDEVLVDHARPILGLQFVSPDEKLKI